MGVRGQPHAPAASTPGKDPVPIVQEAGWAPGPVWTGEKSRSHGDSIPDRPARSSVAIPTELPGPPVFIYPFTIQPLGCTVDYRLICCLGVNTKFFTFSVYDLPVLSSYQLMVCNADVCSSYLHPT
jgi:hypothetical protein